MYFVFCTQIQDDHIFYQILVYIFFSAYPKLDLRDVRREVVDDEIVLASRGRCSTGALLLSLQRVTAMQSGGVGHRRTRKKKWARKRRGEGSERRRSKHATVAAGKMFFS